MSTPAEPSITPGACTARLHHAHGWTRCEITGSHTEHSGHCWSCVEDDGLDGAWLRWTGPGDTSWTL